MLDLKNPHLRRTGSWLFPSKSPKFLQGARAKNVSQKLQQAQRSPLKSVRRGSHHAQLFKSHSAIASAQVVPQS